MSGKVGSPVQKCPLKKEEGKEQNPKLHWIKFKIQDEKGRPLPGVTVLVSDSAGTLEEQTSDANGMIHIKNIKPGNCGLKSDWKMWTVDEVVYFQ